MRIALVIHEFPPVGGGAATAADQTARALVEAGHEVLVVTAGSPSSPSDEVVAGFRVRRLPSLRLRVFAPGPIELLSFCASAALLLSRELREFRAQGVIAYFAVPAGLFATRAARGLGIPCVVSLRGSDVPGFATGRLDGRLGRLAHPAIRAALGGAHRVAPNSEVLADLARRFMPGIADKMVIVRNAIEPAAVADQPSRSGTDTLHLIQVGQLIVRKRVTVTLEAMRALSDVPVHLSIVGTGPVEADLRRDASGLRVAFHGHLARAEILALLRRQDAFVMTSMAEGMSNAMLEAIAAGLPIITTRNGSHDIALAAGCGIVIDVDDVAALAASIRRLAADAAARDRLARAGLEFARGRTWTACAGELAALLAAR